MDKSAKTRRVLFSDTSLLTVDQASQLITIGAEVLAATKEKELVINAIRFALNDTRTEVKDSHQILHFFTKWKSNESTHVRSFIISELKEIVRTLAIGKVLKSDIEANTPAFRKQVKVFGKCIKEALERKLIELFGTDYVKKTASKLKIDEYAVVRFIREDRVPRTETLKDLFDILNINELQYFKR